VRRIQTREEAVKVIEAAGFKAQARTWAMGESIWIVSEVGADTYNDITAYPIGGYIYPLKAGKAEPFGEWGLMDGTNYAPMARFDALDLAVNGAILWFTGLEVQWIRRNK
jgi:hypothetical protein